MVSKAAKEEETSSSESSSSEWPNKPLYNKEEEVEGMRVWGILLFGLIGATATTLAVGQLRSTVNWFYTQLTRSNSTWKNTTGSSYRSTFKEEAWKRYQRRMREEYEEEMERVERIRRMQSVFHRERNKYKRSYQSWRENDQEGYHPQFQRNDWYWKTDTSYKDQRANSGATPRHSGTYMLSHHYSVLGLDRWRTKPYTEDEIKVVILQNYVSSSLKSELYHSLIVIPFKLFCSPHLPILSMNTIVVW
ncbi:hypothetical protein AQUCO_12000023v1 [Aquilegia coerulea]|uniref:Uncharacterized protein n=1 Tax=Aquilegia coerulea TaxID=218851 RepID=A0A2G5C208_AQUCA|nr:hypothetical protein AQUCO_12000023v1 [Aquilegia coerulea]